MEFRVDYVDTDAMGIVHHGNYFRWFERARIEWLRSVNKPYAQMEAEGYFLPLQGSEIRYLKPLKFDDVAVVQMTMQNLTAASVDLKYSIQCRGEVSTTGSTSHVLCKRTQVASPGGELIWQWKPVRFSKDWSQIWEPLKELKL